MIIVTGTGRCGTQYVAELLISAGVPCGHEAHFGPYGWDGAKLANDASWMAAPYLDQIDATVVHLVRHPKQVIDSLRRIGFFNYRQYPRHKPYREFINRVMPGLRKSRGPYDSTRVWAADFVVSWIDLIEANAPDAIVHRIEDDDTKLLDNLGIDYEGKELYHDTTVNHRDGGTISDVELDALPEPYRRWILEICERYGYE